MKRACALTTEGTSCMHGDRAFWHSVKRLPETLPASVKWCLLFFSEEPLAITHLLRHAVPSTAGYIPLFISIYPSSIYL